MKYYKVVRSYEDGRLRSILGMDARLTVFYTEGQWEQAPELPGRAGYHLFVFADKEAATDFASPSHKYQVWECEVEGVFDYLPAFGTYNIDDFERAGSMHDVPDNSLWPEGTIMVERVKLTRRVQ